MFFSVEIVICDSARKSLDGPELSQEHLVHQVISCKKWHVRKQNLHLKLKVNERQSYSIVFLKNRQIARDGKVVKGENNCNPLVEFFV